MISSEKSMVDLVDFKSMSSRESFLDENSNENSSDTVSLRSPDDLAPFFLSYGATTFTINQNFAPEEQGVSVRSSDLIDTRALNSIEISSSVASSERNIVDTADFTSRFPLSGSFLFEVQMKTHLQEKYLVIALLIWLGLSLTLFFHLHCQVRLYMGRRHQRLDCFPVSSDQN
ncbi:hypothetical protein SLA2020_242810 [Shorea laevis]